MLGSSFISDGDSAEVLGILLTVGACWLALERFDTLFDHFVHSFERVRTLLDHLDLSLERVHTLLDHFDLTLEQIPLQLDHSNQYFE